jgi:hypothetical protein
VAVDNGAVPGVVGALADGVHVPGAGGALQQRGGVRGGRARHRARLRLRIRARARSRAAPRAPHLPVPRRCRAGARRGAQRSQVIFTHNTPTLKWFSIIFILRVGTTCFLPCLSDVNPPWD